MSAKEILSKADFQDCHDGRNNKYCQISSLAVSPADQAADTESSLRICRYHVVQEIALSIDSKSSHQAQILQQSVFVSRCAVKVAHAPPPPHQGNDTAGDDSPPRPFRLFPSIENRADWNQCSRILPFFILPLYSRTSPRECPTSEKKKPVLNFLFDDYFAFPER